jgi:hypothetical protein
MYKINHLLKTKIMKTKTWLLAAAFIMFIGNILLAQKPNQISGDFSQLKGQHEIGLIYDYSNVNVGTMPEAAYIKKKMADADKKVPGDGQRWAAEWQSDKTRKYHVKFKQYLNDELSKSGMKADTGVTSGKYSLVVKVIMIEPGFATGTIGSKESHLTVEIRLIENNNPGKILASLLYEDIRNMHYNKFLGSEADFDTGTRIAGVFGTVGEIVGKYLQKQLK